LFATPLSCFLALASVSVFLLIFTLMKPSEVNTKWNQLQKRIAEDFDTDLPDMKVMLFLIGVQELGQGPKKFTKRQKEELMHIAFMNWKVPIRTAGRTGNW
jgi:hypothetical protein